MFVGHKDKRVDLIIHPFDIFLKFLSDNKVEITS